MVDINLFAGTGGLAIGLRTAGFSPVDLYEVDGLCCRTLQHNTQSGTATIVGSVHQDRVQSIDWKPFRSPVRLLAGGVPCQPFSLAGKHLAQADSRNLFPEALRAIRELRPAVVLLENVRGLLRKNFQPYFEYILRQIECPSIKPRPDEDWANHNERISHHQCSTGYRPEYQVSWRLMDAADYGVPQNRLRVFIVGTREELPRFRFPSPTHSARKLTHALNSGEYCDRHRIGRSHIFHPNGNHRRKAENQLLSVGRDADDQNLPQSGRLLYCVVRGFINIYPNS
jgi:DNA (cytosine-5)-methyltransferase 1